MSFFKYCAPGNLLNLGVAIGFAATPVAAQSKPHVILVQMVEKTVGHFAFDPALVVAQRGDTVRFVQSSAAPHNVAFRNPPKGSALGAAMTGPYLIHRGKTYDLVIDARFVDGSYAFVCDPHEAVGMRGTLNIGKGAK